MSSNQQDEIKLAFTSFNQEELIGIERDLKKEVDDRISVASYKQNTVDIPEVVSIIIASWLLPSLGWDLLKSVVKYAVKTVRDRGKQVQKNVWVMVTLPTKTGKEKVINLYIASDNPDEVIESMSQTLNAEFLESITDENLVSLEYVDGKVKVHII